MPEGDVVFRACQQLNQVLAGRTLTRCEFRVPALATTDLTGVEVLQVLARGKHQLFRFGNGFTLHTPLPDGRRLADLSRPVGSGPAARTGRSAACWSTTSTTQSVTGSRCWSCCRPPTRTASSATSGRTCWARTGTWTRRSAGSRRQPEPHHRRGAARPAQPGRHRHPLPGRDPLPAGHPPADAGRRRTGPAPPRGPRPAAAGGESLAGRADHDRRTVRPGGRAYVFERVHQPCRRCGTPIQSEEFGPSGQERRSYWCPHCQPAPT